MVKYLLFLFLINTNLLLSFSIVTASTYSTSAESGTQWLSQQQNIDGSWGGDEEVKSLYTSESVGALRSLYEMVPEYYSGLAWIENHDSANLDYRARRITALAPHGDYLQADLDYIVKSENSQGWGLENVYYGDPLDTALILQSFAQAGYNFAGTSNTLTQLQAAQLTTADCSVVGADCGWALHDEVSSEVITTTQVIKTLKLYETAHSGLDLTTNINHAVLSISNQIDITSSALEKAHTALALLKVDPNSTKAASLIYSLVNTNQLLNGSWDNSEYVTAVALKALAAFTGLDDPTKHVASTIPDPQLRAAINVALGKNFADAVTIGEMKSLTSLDASNYGIIDLTGLETATNLTSVDLQNNAIVSLTPLAGLTSLSSIIVTGNPLSSAEDWDGDGLSDSEEMTIGSDPFTLDPDSDGDGLADVLELHASTCTDYTLPDSDGDGLDDGVEDVNMNGIQDAGETSPCTGDTDGDGLSDGAEVNVYGTNPLNADTDGDGVSDGLEVDVYGTDPLIFNSDTDNDGLSNNDEVNIYGTNPTLADTDSDGADDSLEITHGSDPLDAAQTVFELQLVPGWNIVSIPLEPLNTAVENVMSPLTGTLFTIRTIVDDTTFVYHSTGCGNLTEMHAGTAYEVYVSETTSVTIPVTGTVAGTSFPALQQGWNFVGSTTFNTINVTDVAEELIAVRRTADGSPTLATEFSLNYPADFTTFDPGKGYWVYYFPQVSGSTQTPWQTNATGTLRTNYSWNYTLGYRFTPQANGNITELGGFFNGTKTVYLWDSSKTLLATASVTAANNWSYTAIDPVYVNAGETYTVAVYVDRSGGTYRSGVSPSFPQTYGDIKIEYSTYSYGAGVYPTTTVTSNMYGQADFKFTPEAPAPVDNPWQVASTGSVNVNIGWNYTMGYRFTPLENGQITQLGGYFNGTKTVYLWDTSQNLLASIPVTSANNWAYSPITPVNVTAGQTYTVAVALAGSGGAYGKATLPVVSGKIQINNSTYSYGNGVYPTSHVTSIMYGQADFKFTAEAPAPVETPQLTWDAPADNPWQAASAGSVNVNIGWNYTMGYRFTPLEDGQITQLGGYFNGTKTVYLWDTSQNLLASIPVTSANNWAYYPITPVNVTTGQTYTVAVALAGSGGAYGKATLPVVSGKIQINNSTYSYGNGVYPTSHVTSTMYGQADIKFEVSNTCSTDSDADGLTDGDEIIIHGTNPAFADSDDDGLSDGDEVNVHGSNPLSLHSDADTLEDGVEVLTYGTNPIVADSDGDGLNDDVELLTHNTDPMNPDSDGDSISDGDEYLTYGTDPLLTDTDSDGIDDGEELTYWGVNWNGDSDWEINWNADTDNDGLINLLDADSDNDGVNDGQEITLGSDPANALSVPPVIYTSYFDGEDGSTSGWFVYYNSSAGATITNVFDADRQSNIAEIMGVGIANVYQLRKIDGSDWHNQSEFTLEFSISFTEEFSLYIDVETTAGQRYLTYRPVDTDGLGAGRSIYQGLGSSILDGQWYTFTRDLQEDLANAQPRVTITEVNGLLVKGSGRVDDIRLVQ